MEYNFINNLICDENKNITHAQIVKNEKFSLVVKSELIELDELKNEYAKCKDNQNIEIDYKIDEDGMLICDSKLQIQEINSSISSNLKGSVKETRPYTKNIYELFAKIVDAKGVYVVKEGIEHIEESTIFNYISKFVPNFSKKTMTVYMSVFVDNEWRSDKLIYAENNMLKSSTFYFAVPEKELSNFDEYELNRVGRVDMVGEYYVVLECDYRTPILVYLPDYFTLYPSLVNRYVFDSEMYAMMISNAKLLVEAFKITNIADSDEDEVQKQERDFRPTPSKYVSSYVYFEPSFKRITKAKRTEFYTDITGNLFNKIREQGPDCIVEHVTSLRLSQIEQQNYLYIMKTILDNLGDSRALFTQAESDIDTFTKMKIKADCVLYALRSHMFMFETGYSTMQVMSGSNVPGSSFIRKQIKEIDND